MDSKFVRNRIDRNAVNFKPISDMAVELFTHLGIAFQNPGGPAGSGTPDSVSEFVSQNTDQLLEVAAEPGFGKRKQEALKELAFLRDGNNCPFTGAPFAPHGVNPVLAYVIPNLICSKSDVTLKWIAMFAGTQVRDLVVQQLKSIGNVMNLKINTHAGYDKIEWAIQANEDDGKVTYTFRKLLYPDFPGPGFIRLRDGDEIPFGKGKAEDVNRLGSGPSPVLCNLQYAVAHVLRTSGGADVIAQLKDDADDSDFPHVYLASTDFANILTAKLLLNSGQLVF